MIEVDYESPLRAEDIANAYVDELRSVTSTLAVIKAQLRRLFFENQMQATKAKLAAVQGALEASGFRFNQGALPAEPRAAAESYARLRAELTIAEVLLQALRGSLADATPEVTTQLSVVASLRAQLTRAEQAAGPAKGGEVSYVGRYLEFKYQETLFELFAKQYELARVDESREGALIQVVDPATPPERKTRPRRAFIAIGATLAVFSLIVLGLWVREGWRAASASPAHAGAVARLRAAWRGPR